MEAHGRLRAERSGGGGGDFEKWHSRAWPKEKTETEEAGRKRMKERIWKRSRIKINGEHKAKDSEASKEGRADCGGPNR